MPAPRPRQPRRHLTYANTMATMAVVIATAGGTAYAATAARGSVTSASVKNEALTAKDLKDGKAVGTAEVVDDSLTGADVDETTLTLPAAAPAPGSVGSAAVADGSLTKADLGVDSVTAAALGPLIEVTNPEILTPGQQGTATATCPSGSVAVSGGARPNNFSSDVTMIGLQRDLTGEAWVYTAKNTSNANRVIIAIVYCVA